MDLYKYKNDLEQNKSFRDSEMRRLITIRAKSENFNTISVCNLVLDYIYKLNFQHIERENSKMGECNL